jgi:hypothetical protein
MNLTSAARSADILVRNILFHRVVQIGGAISVTGRCCGQECPRSAKDAQ